MLAVIDGVDLTSGEAALPPDRVGLLLADLVEWSKATALEKIGEGERGLREAASQTWRKVNAPHLVALVRAGARFIDGQLQERSETREEAPLIEEDAAA